MEKQELKHFETQDLRTFGRRHGKRLSARKMWLVDNLLPQIAPKTDEIGIKPMILEIGFGNGEHLCDLAKNNPKSIIIGAEPFMNGVAALLSAITNESDNVLLDEYKNRIFFSPGALPYLTLRLQSENESGILKEVLKLLKIMKG